MGSDEPMSSERLAEIHENWTRVPGNVLRALEHEIHLLECDRTDLLAEVERRRAREAALLAVVRALAAAHRVYSAPGDMLGLPPLKNRAATLIVPIDLQEQARALLASAVAGEQAQGEV